MEHPSLRSGRPHEREIELVLHRPQEILLPTIETTIERIERVKAQFPLEVTVLKEPKKMLARKRIVMELV